MPHTVLTVFLSSTGEDLSPYRDAIHRVLPASEFCKIIRMEDFGPQNANAITYCQEKACACDLFVGVIGLRRGWEPDGDNQKRSITEMEYDWATEAGRERFMCIAPDSFPVPGHLRAHPGPPLPRPVVPARSWAPLQLASTLRPVTGPLHPARPPRLRRRPECVWVCWRKAG